MSNESHCQRGDDETEDSDRDVDLEDDGNIISNAQRAYLENNNSKKQLFLMCFGLTDDNEGGTPMLDLDAEPWNAIKKRDIKPTRMEYAEEIIRRITLMFTAGDRVRHQHKPANWSLAKCMEWLQLHPIMDQQDISFLKNEVCRVKTVILNAEQERRDEEARQAGGQWRGPIPYMRLILCLTEDDIKIAFLRRADARTRLELDARNSPDVRPPTVFELIANKWNDSAFNPVAAVSDCHEDFSSPTNCAHSQVAALMRATPQKVEDALASIRSNLVRFIQNWERSGQGEGGRHAGGEEESDDAGDFVIFDTTSVRFGSLSTTSRSACALQSQAAFLCGKPSYLLYFWEVADRHQLLQSALQRLDDDVGASDASSAPSATSSNQASSGSRRRRRQIDDEEQQQTAAQRDIFDLSQSIRFVSKAEDDRQVRRRIAELQDQARNYRRMYAESDDPNSARARFYQEEVEQITHEIASLEEPLIATPISRNGTPRTPRTP